jgi:hypothetical protein
MSISNLLQPNEYNIFANSITSNSIIGSTGATGILGSLVINTNKGPAILINDTDPLGNPPMVINTQNLSSRLEMHNSNPGCITNGLLTYDNNNVLSLQVGNNNSDGTCFVVSTNHKDLKFNVNGSTEVLRLLGSAQLQNNILFGGVPNTNGKILPYSWSGTTTDGVTQVTVLTIPILANTDATIEVTCQGYVTAGTDINLSLSRKIIISALNAGPGTSINGTTIVSSLNGTGLNSATVSGSANGTNIFIQVLGVASQTIQWTGITMLYT